MATALATSQSAGNANSRAYPTIRGTSTGLAEAELSLGPAYLVFFSAVYKDILGREKVGNIAQITKQ